MRPDKSILKILHRAPAELSNTPRILGFLNDAKNGFNRGYSIEELRQANFPSVIQEAPRYMHGMQKNTLLLRRIHATRFTVLCEDFV